MYPSLHTISHVELEFVLSQEVVLAVRFMYVMKGRSSTHEFGSHVALPYQFPRTHVIVGEDAVYPSLHTTSQEDCETMSEQLDDAVAFKFKIDEGTWREEEVE